MRRFEIIARIFFLSQVAGAGLVRAQVDSARGIRSEGAPAAAEVARDPEAAAVRRMIERGLEFLRSAQLGSGAIGGGTYPVAVTSLGGLSILGAGYRYRDGPYAPTLKLALRFIEENARSDGYISDPKSRMHGHAYAVLFLTQLYGELPPLKQAEVGALIQRGLLSIEKSQTVQGGWYYTPENREEMDEASITICALQAMRAANGIGFAVPKSTVDSAMRYVQKCMNPDGSFRYSLRGPDTHSSFALTVAAVSTLHAAGIYDAPEIQKGLDFARRCVEESRGEPFKAPRQEFFYYANLYAAQAFYQAGGSLWATWYASARRYLLAHQQWDGSFKDASYGEEFGTAAALLILEVPLNYLPVFQR